MSASSGLNVLVEAEVEEQGNLERLRLKAEVEAVEAHFHGLVSLPMRYHRRLML